MQSAHTKWVGYGTARDGYWAVEGGVLGVLLGVCVGV